MSAPTKEGLDYFSFDVDLLDNDDLDFLREKYGVIVNDVYIALLTLLYRKKGYYIPYETETERKDCVWYIYKRVRGGKHPIQQGLIPIVIEAIVAQGLFVSGDLFNKIITSERAQKTYYKATVERKLESFDIRPGYWLLDEETMRKLSKVHPYYLSLYPENKSDEKLSKSDDKQNKSDEKPLNKSKVNKSKVNITSNEVINVSKKESNNKKEIIQSYDEIFEDLEVSERLKSCLIDFIRHLKTSYGILMLNNRLSNLILALDRKYGADELEKCKEIRRAIFNGYKRAECEEDGKEWLD